MALGLGKLTILIGAGVLGSVLAKEGRIPSLSDFVSGALKIAVKPIKQDDSALSASKPKNEALMAQVNSLRKELQLLASSQPLTIVTSSTKGGRRYGIIIMIVVVGYGYAWWKGWKLPDLSIATKRSLSDACTAIAKQLEQVYSSISSTKRNLSSKMDHVDCGLNDVAEQHNATREEVAKLRGDMGSFDVNIQSVRHVVQTLESKMHRMHGKEDEIHPKILRLVDVARNIERSRSKDLLQASASDASRLALELPQLTPSSRAGSLPPVLSLEPPSPSTSNGSTMVQQPLRSSVSAVGLKDLQGIAEVIMVPDSPKVSNGTQAAEDTSPSSILGSYGRKLLASSASFLSRTRSATQSFK
ncbi:hypothetical protein Ancab_018263 [Ancistrocladus abbreviatus]